MYSAKKPPHVLSKFSLDKLIMQELSYHISIGLPSRLHRKKKEPWPSLTLWIGLYEIWNSKHADVEEEEIKKYPVDSRSYNPYDLHCLVKDHCARVEFQWIHEACHWAGRSMEILLQLLQAQLTSWHSCGMVIVGSKMRMQIRVSSSNVYGLRDKLN